MLRQLSAFWARGVGQKIAVVSVAGVLALCSCCSLAAPVGAALGPTGASIGPAPTSTTVVQRATATPRATPTPLATPTSTPRVSHYPPKTHADLTWLAARGDASAIHVATSENVGLVGVCPEPRREVWVSPSVTGERLAEDLLAYFYGEQLDSSCGSLVLVYNSRSEALASNPYSAGRVNLDVTDSSGQANIDPNATKLTYTVTLDVGGVFPGEEYIVAY